MNNFTKIYLQMFQNNLISEAVDVNKTFKTTIKTYKLPQPGGNWTAENLKLLTNLCKEFQKNFPGDQITLKSLIFDKAENLKKEIKEFNKKLVDSKVFDLFNDDEESENNEDENKEQHVDVDPNNVKTNEDGSTTIKATVEQKNNTLNNNQNNSKKIKGKTKKRRRR